jgi:hypothetical protein
VGNNHHLAPFGGGFSDVEKDLRAEDTDSILNRK